VATHPMDRKSQLARLEKLMQRSKDPEQMNAAVIYLAPVDKVILEPMHHGRSRTMQVATAERMPLEAPAPTQPEVFTAPDQMGGESPAALSQNLSPSLVVEVYKALGQMDVCDDILDALDQVGHMDGPDLDTSQDVLEDGAASPLNPPSPSQMMFCQHSE